MFKRFRIAGDNPDGSVAVESAVGIVDVYIHSPYPSSIGQIMPEWAWHARVGGTDVNDLYNEDVRECARAAVGWLAEQIQPPSHF